MNQTHLPEGGEWWFDTDLCPTLWNNVGAADSEWGSDTESECKGELTAIVQEATRRGREAGIREAMEKLDRLPAWPDPVKDLDNGISAMFDSGLITQYKHDKEKHDREIRELKASIEALIQNK